MLTFGESPPRNYTIFFVNPDRGGFRQNEKERKEKKEKAGAAEGLRKRKTKSKEGVDSRKVK
jgi:hypothetical protein